MKLFGVVAQIAKDLRTMSDEARLTRHAAERAADAACEARDRSITLLKEFLAAKRERRQRHEV